MARNSLCPMRAEADVSAIADPNAGVLVFHSFLSAGVGFYHVGGASVAVPLIGGIHGERNDNATTR